MRCFHVVFNITASSSLEAGTATFHYKKIFNQNNPTQQPYKTNPTKAANVRFESTSIVNIIEMSEDEMNAFAPDCPFLGVV